MIKIDTVGEVIFLEKDENSLPAIISCDRTEFSIAKSQDLESVVDVSLDGKIDLRVEDPDGMTIIFRFDRVEIQKILKFLEA